MGCPAAIAALLVQRGITEPAAAQSFFNPSLDDLIDPMLMLGMPMLPCLGSSRPCGRASPS